MSEKLEELISLLYQDRLTQYGKRLLVENIEKLQQENEEVKRLIAHKNEYTKKLEEDLFENAENYVISKQKVKDKIRHYQELQDNYIKKYDEINEGLQAMINALQELIEEREEK